MGPEGRKPTTIIFGLILASILGYGLLELSNFYYFNEKAKEVLNLRESVQKLKESNDEDELIKTNANQLEIKLLEAEQSYSSLKPLIPNESELPKIMDWIESRAKERNLKLEHFSRGQYTSQVTKLTEIPIQVEVLGYFDAVSRFLQDFSRCERILKVRGVHMTREPLMKDPQYQTMRATISVSAYVSKGPKVIVSNNIAKNTNGLN